MLACVASAAHAQCPEQRLLPFAQPSIGDFGSIVAMNDRHLIVADRQSDFLCGGEPSCNSGLVYAYQRGADGSWELIQTILSSDAGRAYAFGDALALDGDRMVVGAPGSDLVWPDVGAAYVFEFDGEQWVEVDRFGEPLPITDNEFASIVAMSGDVILASNYFQVFLFRKRAEGWTYVETINSPSALGSGIAFGAMALNDEWLFIGDAFDRTMGSEAGAVHVYRWGVDGRPVYVESIYTPIPEDGRRFGGSVALDGDTLAVGATNARQRGRTTGAVYMYSLTGGHWTATQRVLPAESDDMMFGGSIALEVDRMAVGAPNDRIGGPWGSVRLYERDGIGRWQSRGTVLPGSLASQFGGSVTMSGDELAVGARQTQLGGVDQGSVDIFDLACLLCRPDLDADGRLTIFDYLTFLNLFDDGDARADFDGDGELTVFDFLAFQTAFDAGCD